MKASGRLAVIAALLVGSILVIGGCHDPAAARATARRWEQAHRPIELYEAREARSPVGRSSETAPECTLGAVSCKPVCDTLLSPRSAPLHECAPSCTFGRLIWSCI